MKVLILMTILIIGWLCVARMIIEIWDSWKWFRGKTMDMAFERGFDRGRKKGRGDVYAVLTNKEYLDIRERMDNRERANTSSV